MDIRQAIRFNFAFTDTVVQSYTADLSDEELVKRPIPGLNCIAWQLGHLISAERSLAEKVSPGGVSPLPLGFAERHTNETAASDANVYLPKAEYLALMAEVRKYTLQSVDAHTSGDFDQPVPNIFPLIKSAGDLYLFIGGHWMMHTGQWAAIRRALGRPPLF